MEGKCFPAAFLLLLMIPFVIHLGNSMGSEVRDVAITSVAAWPNLTLPSYVRVNVTVENQGTSYDRSIDRSIAKQRIIKKQDATTLLILSTS